MSPSLLCRHRYPAFFCVVPVASADIHLLSSKSLKPFTFKILHWEEVNKIFRKHLHVIAQVLVVDLVASTLSITVCSFSIHHWFSLILYDYHVRYVLAYLLGNNQLDYLLLIIICIRNLIWNMSNYSTTFSSIFLIWHKKKYGPR